MLIPAAIIAVLLAQPPESRLCGVVGAGSDPRYVVVPDAHQFPSGFNLADDERLVVIPCRGILRRDGAPDFAKLKEILS